MSRNTKRGRGGLFAAALMLVMVPAARLVAQSALHLDHVPLVVRDLPAAIAQFRAMGFTIKPGRPHQDGIENASIKFADGSYLELITSHGAGDALSAEYREFLRHQEGAAYAFLRDRADGSFTARVLQAGGRRSEVGPFAFTELPVWWRAPHLQLIQYLAPAKDSAATYEHPNGARRIAAIWTLVERPADPVMRAFGARRSDLGALAFEDRESQAAALADGTCLEFTPRNAHDPARSLARAVLIEVNSLTLASGLQGQTLLARGSARWLSPAEMHGVWIGFVDRTAWAGIRCAV